MLERCAQLYMIPNTRYYTKKEGIKNGEITLTTSLTVFRNKVLNHFLLSSNNISSAEALHTNEFVL